MLKRGWLCLWLAANAAAATVYLRSGAPAGVELTNCSNSSPIVCTSSSDHGLKPGDFVVIENVVGNTNANGARKVLEAVSPRRFSLAGVDDAPVSGNGLWNRGGLGDNAAPTPKIAGKALPYELQAHPRVLLDGPNGKFTRRLRCAVANGCLTNISLSSSIATANIAPGHGITVGSKIGVWNAGEAALNHTYTVSTVSDTSISFPVNAGDGTYANPDLTISRYAYEGNPAWDTLVSTASSLAGNYTALNSNPTMEKFLAAALVWFTDRSRTQFLDMARHAALNVEDAIYGTTACDQSGGYCNGRSGTDYGRFNAVNASAIYSILVAENQLSPEERKLFADKMLNDVDTGCEHAPIQTGTGSITTIFNKTKVNGTGGRFRDELGAGDTIWIPEFGLDENVYRVKQVDSDTELDLSLAVGPNFSGRFKHARKWNPGDCGVVNILKFHPHGLVGDPKIYPTTGGSQTSFYHNLTLTALWSYMHIGLALADEDPRARRLLEGAWLYGYDYTIGYAMNSWTGLTQSGGVYHWYRTTWMAADIAFALKYSVVDYPDLLAGSPQWLSSVLPLTYYSYLPNADLATDSGYGPLFGEGSLGVRGYWLSYQARVARLFADTDESKSWHWWLKNTFGFTPANLADNQGQGAVSYYLGVDPGLEGIDNTSLPTQALFNKTGYEVCAQLGMRLCDTAGKKYAMAVSRSGWTSKNDSELQIYGGTFQPDHFENQAGDYRLVKGLAGDQPCLLGADARTCATAYNGYGQNNLLEFGPGADRKGGAAIGDDPISDITRWKADGSNQYTYAMVDLTGVFRPAGGIERAQRHFVHLKKLGAQELVIVYDDAATRNPNTIRAYSHYSQNNREKEGTTWCEGGCSTNNIDSGRIISKSLANSLITQYLPVRRSTRFRLFVDNRDGTYKGGNGFSFRVTYCATSNDETCGRANAMEALIVHRLAEGADTELTAEPLSLPEAWTGVQTLDSVVLFARQNGHPDRLDELKTTHSGTARYVITGLAPGRYDITRDGSRLAAGLEVLATERMLFFEAEAGTFAVQRAERAEGGEDGDPPSPEIAAGIFAARAVSSTGAPAPLGSCGVAMWQRAAELEARQADSVLMEWGPAPNRLVWSQPVACPEDCMVWLGASSPFLFLRKTFRSHEVPVHVGPIDWLRVDSSTCM